MSAVTTSPTYDRLKELYPNQTHLTPTDFARATHQAPDTVRRNIVNGRLRAGFVKMESGPLLISMKATADYLDGLPRVDDKQQPFFDAYEPSATPFFLPKKMPPRRGPGGSGSGAVRGLQVFHAVGFENASAYSGLDMLALSGRFEGSFELQSLLLKFGIWIYRMGLNIPHKDIQALSSRVESLTTSLDNVEACSVAFMSEVVLSWNSETESDNLESILSLAMYFSEHLEQRFIEV